MNHVARSIGIGILAMACGGGGQADADDGETGTGTETGTGDGPNGACGSEPPTESYEAGIAELGLPYDTRADDAWASPAGPSGRFGSHPRIVPHANADGTLDVAWDDEQSGAIFVSHLCQHDGEWHAAWHLDAPSLDRLVGFARDEAGAFFVATAVAEGEIQYEPEPIGLHRDDILQVTRLDPDGSEAFRVDLRSDITNPDATPIYGPLSYGTGVLAAADGQVVTGFAAFTEYDEAVMSRHQYCLFVTLDASSGELTSLWGGPSHCFDQKLVFDGTDFVGSALGDAGFRGIGLSKINVTPWDLSLAVKGGDGATGGGYQNTFTRMGNVALGENGYAQVFATENVAEYTIDTVNASRNVGFVHLIPDVGSQMPANRYDIAIVDTGVGNDAAVDFDVEVRTYFGDVYEGKNKQIVWLTDYGNAATEHAERPKLVRLREDTYVVLWEKWTLDTYVETMGMVVDEYGNTIVDATSLGSARLQRGDSPVATSGRAAWVVGEPDGPRLVLYLVDDQLQLERHEIE